MRFVSPFFLVLLMIVPLLIIAGRWLRKETIVPAVRFSDFRHGFEAGIHQMRRTLFVKALPILRVLRFVVLALLIFTLARPQLSQSRVHRFAEGIDIL